MKAFKIMGVSALAALALTGCNDSLDFYPQITTNESNTMDKLEYYNAEVNNWYTWLPKLMDAGDVQGLASRDGDCDFGTGMSGAISASKMSQPEKNNYYNKYYERVRSINYLEYYA